MERKKYILTALCILLHILYGVTLSGQKQYSDEIYQAYISGDMAKWENVIGTLENSGTPAISQKFELAEYYYAHIGYLLGMGSKTEAKNYIEKADVLIENILKTEPDNAAATSLKGIFVAYRMELNKLKAPVLGPQCMRLIKKAHSLDPSDVQALSDLGNMYYHCPAVFGGDKIKGIRYIYDAVRMMEEKKESAGNWFYLNLLTMLAQYEAESGSKEKAKEIYEKILSIEPEFIWVRDELYPQ
ncbi:MAG: hypothetical protein LIO79_00485 [Rikenellaceae bacterium]|nr:hypothetical protein [Rikenellaceae bacterium]